MSTNTPVLCRKHNRIFVLPEGSCKACDAETPNIAARLAEAERLLMLWLVIEKQAGPETIVFKRTRAFLNPTPPADKGGRE